MRETWQVCVGFEHTVQCMLAVSDLVDYTRAGADPGGGGWMGWLATPLTFKPRPLSCPDASTFKSFI